MTPVANNSPQRFAGRRPCFYLNKHGNVLNLLRPQQSHEVIQPRMQSGALSVQQQSAGASSGSSGKSRTCGDNRNPRSNHSFLVDSCRWGKMRVRFPLLRGSVSLQTMECRNFLLSWQLVHVRHGKATRSANTCSKWWADNWSMIKELMIWQNCLRFERIESRLRKRWKVKTHAAACLEINDNPGEQTKHNAARNNLFSPSDATNPGFLNWVAWNVRKGGREHDSDILLKSRIIANTLGVVLFLLCLILRLGGRECQRLTTKGWKSLWTSYRSHSNVEIDNIQM